MARFVKKTPKTQKPYSSDYVSHNPHTVNLSNRNWPDRIKVISIDPGLSNFGIRVEERPLKNNLTPILPLLYKRYKIEREDQELTENNLCKIYSIISNFLDEFLPLFLTCHVLIIEKQLPHNYKAVRISQHTLTYFMTHLKNTAALPLFFEVNPKLKGKELGAPPNLNERGIKVWAVEEALRLLEIRKDTQSIDVINNNRKKDDLADTVCQIEAMFSILGWATTKEINKTETNKPEINKTEINKTEINKTETGTKSVKLKINRPATGKKISLNILT